MAHCRKCGAKKTTKRAAGVFFCQHCGMQPGVAKMDRAGNLPERLKDGIGMTDRLLTLASEWEAAAAGKLADAARATDDPVMADLMQMGATVRSACAKDLRAILKGAGE